ncbi:MAG: transcriptional repressor LexA [Bacteroidota bacterium]
MKELTEKQKAVLDFIESFIREKGFPPTIREICREFNISSTFGVKRHLDALSKKGYLNIKSNLSRALSLVGSEKSGISGFDGSRNDADRTDTGRSDDGNMTEIPIVGRVAAGMPLLALENIEGNIKLDPAYIKMGAGCFALRVKGDSMINAGIFEGDLVIVSPRSEAYNGEIVIAQLGDEATVKRFERKGNEVFLIAENTRYKPIIVKEREDFSIIGKVVGVLRWYN